MARPPHCRLPLGAAALAGLWTSTLLVGACGPDAGGTSADGAAQPAARHVVLITLDTTRADHLGCYGAPNDTSPNLDRLAASGVRFERCISTASVTPVSHASILTGLNPYRHGLRVMYAGSHFSLPDDVPTLATVLADAGWRTGAILSAFPVSELFGLQRGFEHYDDGLEGASSNAFVTDTDGRSKWDLHRLQRRSDETTDAAIEWLRGLDTASEPFLLWVHYWDPHDGGILPPEGYIQRHHALQGPDADPMRILYDAEIEFVDAQIGRLVGELEQLGVWDETLLAVTADHGQGLMDHDWHAHRLLYQEHIRLPLIVRSPAGPRGAVVEDLVRSIDLYPTLLELVGVPAPAPVEGASLTGLMLGGREPGRVAYADQLNLWDANAAMLEKRPHDDLLHCLMDRRWKLIHRPLAPQRSELYDLENDPAELANLYAPDHPEVRRLLAELERLGPFVLEPLGEGSDDPSVLEALGDLGYLGEDDDDGADQEEPRSAQGGSGGGR